jgi:glycosyltransferase involved in cell wall biosynthesis
MMRDDEEGTMVRSCKVMLCLATDGVGPAETCRKICEEWPALGRRTVIYTSRRRVPDRLNIYRSVLPQALSFLPYRLVRAWAVPRAARRCTRDIEPGEMLYVWPAAPLADVAAAKAKGAVVVKESINTHTGYAKALLDEASERIGAPPQHAITEAAIREEDELLALSDYVFAPNAFVEASLTRAGVGAEKILPTSYGTDLDPRPDAPRTERAPGPVRFLFAGRACVRKGVHRLLEAWSRAAIAGELIFAGNVDQFIAERYRDILADPSVKLVGFHRDIARLYRQADVFVFPSLEEGGPQVCYEAAAFGLPQITTAMGGGRIARDGRNALIVAPDDAEALEDALRRLAASAELRANLGANALSDVQAFTWPKVARQRHQLLVDRAGI